MRTELYSMMERMERRMIGWMCLGSPREHRTVKKNSCGSNRGHNERIQTEVAWTFFEPVSVLNSQSVLRNDVILYGLACSV